MSKFNPAKVPKWCKWIAVDKDGECWAFENKPATNTVYKCVWDTCFSDEAVRLYKGKPPKNWKDELYTWG